MNGRSKLVPEVTRDSAVSANQCNCTLEAFK
jgi:hypothetical protein